jgi:hypothetical protein
MDSVSVCQPFENFICWDYTSFREPDRRALVEFIFSCKLLSSRVVVLAMYCSRKSIGHRLQGTDRRERTGISTGHVSCCRDMESRSGRRL